MDRMSLHDFSIRCSSLDGESAVVLTVLAMSTPTGKHAHLVEGRAMKTLSYESSDSAMTVPPTWTNKSPHRSSIPQRISG